MSGRSGTGSFAGTISGRPPSAGSMTRNPAFSGRLSRRRYWANRAAVSGGSIQGECRALLSRTAVMKASSSAAPG
jgi:hypothetical protein